MELICTNSKHDSGIKFTSPEFFIPFRTQLVNRPVFPFATLETTKKQNKRKKQAKKKLEPKCVPQFILGSLLGTRQSAVGQFFFLSLVTVPEVFMKVKSAKFSSFFFLKWRMQTINNQYVPRIPLYWGAWVTPAGEPVDWPCSWNEKQKYINVTVTVKFETTQLSFQHVLLFRVRTTRQIWRNLGGCRSEVGVTRNVCAWPF